MPCLQNNSSLRACQGRRPWPPFILTLDMSVRSRSVRHTIREEYRQLGVDHAPVLPSASPFLRNIHHGKIQHFQQAVICGEHGFCLGHFPKLTVEALDGIGRIDQAANLLGVLEIGAEMWPVIPPGLRDFGVFLIPMFGKVSRASRAADSSTAA